MQGTAHDIRAIRPHDTMPKKLKKIFEKEYGKKKGDRIFYAWERKHEYGERKMRKSWKELC